MFLRSLTIRGFKSFADKTLLEFTPGVSVIVGPNGSGKSNIADAISWVLGEQGPRAMRGGQMADVIFAGSATRPGLGLAEVKLVIDNSEGLIPAASTEIEISRTIYRSGETEYRLGGRPCRLLDIQELLSDTGVGRGLHTVIGQGQLDDVLSARPEDRRALLEEAAGVAKHRRRRERAERKLSGLEADLARLRDLVAELRRQLKPLRQQAELARRHEALTEEAAELAKRLAAAALRDLYGDRERHRPSWERADALRRQARQRLSLLEERIGRAEVRRAEADAAQRRSEASYEEALRAKSDTEEALRSAIREESEGRRRLAAASSDSGRLFALQEEFGRTQRARDAVEETLRQREQDLERTEESFLGQRAARQRAEDDRRRLTEEAASNSAERQTLERTLRAHEEELRDLRGKLAATRQHATACESRAEALQTDIERLDASETPLAEEQAALERSRAELSGAVADWDAAEKGLLARREVIEARKEELSDSVGACFARSRGQGPIGVLRDLIAAPAGLGLALTAALGPLGDAVVYATGAEALRDAAIAQGSGATLIGRDASPDLPTSIPGLTPLLGQVRPDTRVRALAEMLLQRVYLVGDLPEALAKHSLHPREQFVTPDGVVVGASFIRTAASEESKLEGIRREAAALDGQLGLIRRRLREGRQRLSEMSSRASAVGSRLEEIDGLITAAAEEMSSQRTKLASLHREEELLKARQASVEALAAGVRDRLSAIASEPPQLPPLPALADPPVHLRVEVEALRREGARLEAGLERALRQLEALAREDPKALREAVERAELRRDELEASLKDATERLWAAAARHRHAADEARLAREAEGEANRAWRDAAAEIERLRNEHEFQDRAREDLERRIAEAERVLRQGYEVDPAQAVEALGDGDTVEAVRRQSDLVARRLTLLGKVNALAAEELGAMEERHDFLARELEDVEAARRHLIEVIAQVDSQMAGLLWEAFSDVSREYASVFSRLFPGGEGRLTLTDPDDILRSGIEIEARPGGKRVRRLSLLSGGERSLAALACLFGVFRARPSPFCLMDEAEAALDDINLQRFLDVVKELSERSQMLVVTHQKRTMEVADVLYGVSMGRDGASTVISQRLEAVGAG